jgi:hypothetical protein
MADTPPPDHAGLVHALRVAADVRAAPRIVPVEHLITCGADKPAFLSGLPQRMVKGSQKSCQLPAG